MGKSYSRQGRKSNTVAEPRKSNNYHNKTTSISSSSFLDRIAIFGDSGFALFLSFFFLVLAVLISLYIENENSNGKSADLIQSSTYANSKRSNSDVDVDDDVKKFQELYEKLGPIPKIDPPRVFSIQEEDSLESIHHAYKRDGVVAVRGLIPSYLLERLDVESFQLIEKLTATATAPTTTKSKIQKGKKKRNFNNQQFYVQQNGAAFLDPPSMIVYQDDDDDDDGNGFGNENKNSTSSRTTLSPTPKLENITAFLEVALLSQVPTLASELMLPELTINEEEKESVTVRMIRDIFLTRSSDQNFACGWHTDDTGFWPATKSSAGINAWIALDDMPSVGGGGFALAVGSHESSWRHDAQYITGATTYFPLNGYQSAADMFANRTGSGTCNIQTSAPHLYKRLEETKRIYNLQKGDVIFHQRWMFHRTVPFDKGMEKNLLYRRYSVRFSPGTAIIPPGYGTELSVLWNETNGNRTADQVSELDGPWYPRVWPTPNMKELGDLKSLVEDKMPIAEERKSLRKKEMKPFLAQASTRSRRPRMTPTG